MRKAAMRLRGVLAAVAVCLLLPAGVLMAYEVPKDLEIKRLPNYTPQSDWIAPSVQFPHGIHAVKNACKTCHHKESGKNLGEFVACTECHDKAAPEDPTGFYLAWHNDSPQSCLGCHRKLRLENPANMQPISCTDGCHPKK